MIVAIYLDPCFIFHALAPVQGNETTKCVKYVQTWEYVRACVCLIQHLDEFCTQVIVVRRYPAADPDHCARWCR